jgi:hypothetical protein
MHHLLASALTRARRARPLLHRAPAHALALLLAHAHTHTLTLHHVLAHARTGLHRHGLRRSCRGRGLLLSQRRLNDPTGSYERAASCRDPDLYDTFHLGSPEYMREQPPATPNSRTVNFAKDG